MTKKYYTVNGVLLAERNAKGRNRYLPDVIGSITGVRFDDSSAAFASYTPYGTGGGVAGVSFGWIGALGYMQTGFVKVSHYIRARYYDSVRARWLSRDRFWPSEPASLYANSNPVNNYDPSGTVCASAGGCCCKPSSIELVSKLSYTNAETPKPPGYKNYTGIGYTLALKWTFVSNDETTLRMPPCKMLWEERASNWVDVKRKLPPFDHLAPIPPDSWQMRQWQACTNYGKPILCEDGNCYIHDYPGLGPQDRYATIARASGKSYIHDVCGRVKLMPGCAGAKIKIKTVHFRLEIPPNAPPILSLVVTDGDTPCIPRKNPNWGK